MAERNDMWRAYPSRSVGALRLPADCDLKIGFGLVF